MNMTHAEKTRTEKDSMGEFQVPDDAYYGAQTARAVANFPVSGIHFSRPFIQALGAVKRAAAEVNVEMGLLDLTIAEGIYQAADEVIDGKLDDQFVVDIYQTGSGTSTNMNTNEVISNRAIERLGGVLGSKSPVHPNDHVNKSQSSNDVIPTVIHIAAATELETRLLPALRSLHTALAEKAREWDEIVKIGRTHLMDATPIRLGQEASGWARQVALSIGRLEIGAAAACWSLRLAGRRLAQGINSPVGFGSAGRGKNLRHGLVCLLSKPRIILRRRAARTPPLSWQTSCLLSRRHCLRLQMIFAGFLPGPRCGLGELSLPAVQPGSSIMPGKVNPVMCEQLMMVCSQADR